MAETKFIWGSYIVVMVWHSLPIRSFLTFGLESTSWFSSYQSKDVYIASRVKLRASRCVCVCACGWWPQIAVELMSHREMVLFAQASHNVRVWTITIHTTIHVWSTPHVAMNHRSIILAVVCACIHYVWLVVGRTSETKFPTSRPRAHKRPLTHTYVWSTYLDYSEDINKNGKHIYYIHIHITEQEPSVVVMAYSWWWASSSQEVATQSTKEAKKRKVKA